MNEMRLMVPVDCNEAEEAKITKLDDLKYWAVFSVNEGRFSDTVFYNSREEIKEWVDIVVVIDKNEYVWSFMEENIAVLMVSTQRYIEDIQEAFLFKELHDMNI